MASQISESFVTRSVDVFHDISDCKLHHSLVSTIYNWWVSVFGNLKVDNVGKYLENFLGVDTVYSNNERSERQLARLVSRAALLCWCWMLPLNC